MPKYYIGYMLKNIGFSVLFIADTSTVEKLISCRSAEMFRIPFCN